MKPDAKVNIVLDRLMHYVARISATKALKGGSLSKNEYR
jgi:hypothetical protein